MVLLQIHHAYVGRPILGVLCVFGFDDLVEGLRTSKIKIELWHHESVASFALIAWFSQTMELLQFHHHMLNRSN